MPVFSQNSCVETYTQDGMVGYEEPLRRDGWVPLSGFMLLSTETFHSQVKMQQGDAISGKGASYQPLDLLMSEPGNSEPELSLACSCGTPSIASWTYENLSLWFLLPVCPRSHLLLTLMVASSHLSGTGPHAFLLQGPSFVFHPPVLSPALPHPALGNTVILLNDACKVCFVILHCSFTGVRVRMVTSFRERLIYFYSATFVGEGPALDPLGFPLAPPS